jgi:hypothetical protein
MSTYQKNKRDRATRQASIVDLIRTITGQKSDSADTAKTLTRLGGDMQQVLVL